LPDRSRPVLRRRLVACPAMSKIALRILMGGIPPALLGA
jgi:hypothetical protein